MEIKVINNVPNIKVTVNQHEDDKFAILLAEDKKSTLGSVKPGSTVKLGNREYIVLGHGAETTAIIAKKFTKTMCFGNTGDYATSDVRKFCNGEFLNELAVAVGMDNIVEHTVNLIADDGTGKGKTCKDKVSIITTENYRRYRKFLEAYDDWWWTATKVTYSEGYARDVCYVDSDGILNWGDCGCYLGVRPFCILNSSVSIPYDKISSKLD